MFLEDFCFPDLETSGTWVCKIVSTVDDALSPDITKARPFLISIEILIVIHCYALVTQYGVFFYRDIFLHKKTS